MSTEVVATVSLAVAIAQWDVSEEELLTTLADNPDGPTTAADGTWHLPSSWLDANFKRSSVIDLRDIGSELSTILNHLLVTQERLGQAEVRAAVAETEVKYLERNVERLEGELQRAEADAEHWMAEHDRREVDLADERAKVAKAQSATDQMRFQLVQTEGRLDDTYRDLLHLQDAAKEQSKRGVFGRLRPRKERE